MEPFARRELFTRALAAGVGASVVSPFLSQAAAATAPTTGPKSDVDPNFVAGEIAAVEASGALKVIDYDGIARSVVVQPGSQVWKAAQFNQSAALASGDCIYARGDLNQSDGTLLVDRMWANITSFAASVQGSTPRSLALALADGRRVSVAVIAGTESNLPDGTTATGSASAFKVGDPVQVVAFSEPSSAVLSASKVIALETPDANVSPDANPCNNTGIASYFCCGNVSGCGTCYVGSNGGYCGGCRSDRMHMAWPKVPGCGPYCGNCCLESNFPTVSCNSFVSIGSVCRAQYAGVYVKDCGPTVRCMSPYGCGNLPKVLYDLTPCAFTAVGGGLDSGLVDIDAANC